MRSACEERGSSWLPLQRNGRRHRSLQCPVLTERRRRKQKGVGQESEPGYASENLVDCCYRVEGDQRAAEKVTVTAVMVVALRCEGWLCLQTRRSET